MRSLDSQRGVNSSAELQGRQHPGRICSEGSTSTTEKATLVKTRQCCGQSDSCLGGMDEGHHSCQDRRLVTLLSSLAFSPLPPPVLAVLAALNPLCCFISGLLSSFSSMRMLLRQSDYSSQQKLDCVKTPKIYPEVYRFT